MKLAALLLLVAVVVGVTCPLASALNISFASVDGATDRDVYHYSSSGTLIGLYNTSSTGISVTSDSVFMFKPHGIDPFEEPQRWITETGFPWVKANFIGLLVLCFLIYIAFGRR